MSYNSTNLMSSLFSHEFFTKNRQSLVSDTRAKLIVLTANGLLQRSADTTYKFRQDSNFWYLTGVEEPDYTLVIYENDSYLIEPKRSEHRDLWDGAVDKEGLLARSGIHDVLDHHTGWNKLDKQIKSTSKVHTIAPAEVYFEHFGFYANPARAALLGQIEKHKKAQVVDIRKDLARLRQIKQVPEIEAIKLAINTTLKSLEKVKNNLKKYKAENQIVADVTRDFIRGGCAGHAYSPIVAYGQNATTIHYVDTDASIGDSGLVLLDIGAEYSNYSADITRTFSIGKPSKREAKVHKSVVAVKKYATELIKPGIKLREYEKKVDIRMGEELKKLGLISRADDMKSIKKYYPHLVSHHLGLDTHDAADYDLPLAPGMVVTIEPGIYIPEEGIGIRLEDDVLVTASGCLNLSDSLSTSLS